MHRGTFVCDRAAASPDREQDTVPEKSPQKPSGKKAGKSLMEKREAKKAKKAERSIRGL